MMRLTGAFSFVYHGTISLMNTKNKSNARRSGFTVVEVIIVIVIIGILLALGVGSWTSSQNHARRETAIGVAEKVKLSLGKYFNTYDRYPSTRAKVTTYLTEQGDTTTATTFSDTAKFDYLGMSASGGPCDDTTVNRCEKYRITVKRAIWQGGTTDTDVTVTP